MVCLGTKTALVADTASEGEPVLTSVSSCVVPTLTELMETSCFFFLSQELYYMLILGLASGETPSFCYWSEYVLPTDYFFLRLSQ